jgi:hypothetical protein
VKKTKKKVVKNEKKAEGTGKCKFGKHVWEKYHEEDEKGPALFRCVSCPAIKLVGEPETPTPGLEETPTPGLEDEEELSLGEAVRLSMTLLCQQYEQMGKQLVSLAQLLTAVFPQEQVEEADGS